MLIWNIYILQYDLHGLLTPCYLNQQNSLSFLQKYSFLPFPFLLICYYCSIRCSQSKLAVFLWRGSREVKPFCGFLVRTESLDYNDLPIFVTLPFVFTRWNSGFYPNLPSLISEDRFFLHNIRDFRAGSPLPQLFRRCQFSYPLFHDLVYLVSPVTAVQVDRV